MQNGKAKVLRLVRRADAKWGVLKIVHKEPPRAHGTGGNSEDPDDIYGHSIKNMFYIQHTEFLVFIVT